MTYKYIYYYQLDIIVDFIHCLNYLFLYFQFVFKKKKLFAFVSFLLVRMSI